MAHDKPEKADKPEPSAKTRHKAHEHATGIAFVRAGDQMVNLAHIVTVSLPVEGDPKKSLELRLVTGTNLQLSGEDAAAVVAALEGCCGAEE